MKEIVQYLISKELQAKIQHIKHCEYCSHKFTEGEEKHPYHRDGKRTRYICSACLERLEG